VRRWLPMALLGILFVGALIVAAQPEHADTPAGRVDRIASEIRCPTCKGLSVAESDAEAATAAKAFIADRVEAGATDAQIKADLRARFGSAILLRPPARGVAGLVWAIPVGVGVLAAGGLAVAVQRWRRRPLHHASDADVVLVAKAQGS
jgi:cytochrome c-type biogenesis protein CcmH